MNSDHPSWSGLSYSCCTPQKHQLLEMETHPSTILSRSGCLWPPTTSFYLRFCKFCLLGSTHQEWMKWLRNLVCASNLWRWVLLLKAYSQVCSRLAIDSSCPSLESCPKSRTEDVTADRRIYANHSAYWNCIDPTCSCTGKIFCLETFHNWYLHTYYLLSIRWWLLQSSCYRNSKMDRKNLCSCHSCKL